MRTIGLEEHYAYPAFWDGPGRFIKEQVFRMPALIEDLTDLGEKRIAAMDEAGIDVQVLSLTNPGVEQLDATEAVGFAREANDYLASAIRRFPDRFTGFATLATPAPDTAADELEMRVKNDGFKGGVINGHSRGRYLDDKFFWPILERAESLGVPLYLHPTQPPKPVVEAYYSGFEDDVMHYLSRAGWGWHIETSVHLLRMIFGGVFKAFPTLQVIIGHLGEGLPFMMSRVDQPMSPSPPKAEPSVSTCLRKNVHYHISGFVFVPSFLHLLMQVGVDRIMFSTDYPYLPLALSREFLENLPVSPADKERIAHGNAERLLRM